MRRSGFTLMELILVMGIIVVTASLTFPLYETLFDSHKIQAAADKVRAQWVETRNRAMAEGISYRFSIKDHSSEYRIEPDDPAEGTEFDAEEGSLPEQVQFVNGDANPQSGGDWTPLIVFLADGTARNDARVSLGAPNMTPITLYLRALTGAISTEDPRDGGVQP